MRFLCPGNSPIGNSERLLGQVVAGLSGLCISHVFSFAALSCYWLPGTRPGGVCVFSSRWVQFPARDVESVYVLKAVEAKAAWLSCSFVSAHALDPWTHIRYTPVHPAPALITYREQDGGCAIANHPSRSATSCAPLELDLPLASSRSHSLLRWVYCLPKLTFCQ